MGFRPYAIGIGPVATGLNGKGHAGNFGFDAW